MSKFIVTTTIFKPSEALNKFSRIKNWSLIVVGDKKTPHNLYKNNKNIIYLSPLDQKKIDPKLSELIGWNCIQRRNFGYILAYKLGAKLIATVDDDNIPYKFWGDKIFINKKVSINLYFTDQICFDPLSIFKNNQNLWHRGFPLELINKRNYEYKKRIFFRPDVQANLWNMCPDIDAINRFSVKKENYKFNLKGCFSSNKFMPFNSQNTFLSRNVIKDYFLFPFIGRMDDIWASYYLQGVGAKVIFSGPTVYQKRNVHNTFVDFKKELIGYLNNYKLLENIKKNPNNIKKFLPKRSYEAFLQYKSVFKK